MNKLTIKTKFKTELVDITEDVKEAVIKSGISDGAVVVFVPHSTCSVFIAENKDPNLRRDILEELHNIVPSNKEYHHMGKNADGHIKSAIMGVSVTIPVENASLLIGHWQGIFLGEFDGGRERNVYIKTIK